jgi:hypothetical protein
VVDGAVAGGVAVVDVVGEAVGVAVADGVAVVDVVGEAVGVAVAPLLATVKYHDGWTWCRPSASARL